MLKKIPNCRLLASSLLLALVAACSQDRDPSDDSFSRPSGASDAFETTQSFAPGSFDEFSITAGDRIYYGFDKYNIAPEYQIVADNQAAWLTQYANVNLVIAGHCDARGTREYNLALGMRRSNSHKNALVARGIDPSRVTTISYGKERPLVEGTTEADYAQNRVTIISFA